MRSKRKKGKQPAKIIPLKKEYYTTKQIAPLLYVTFPTVISYIDKGHLKSFKTMGGHRRILTKDLIDFIKKNKYPMPKELI